MARGPLAGIERDLRSFHREGGAGYWAMSDTPLEAISKLRLVQARARRGFDPDAIPDAVRAAIRGAVERLERQYMQATLVLLGFSGAGGRGTARRTDEAALVLGYKSGRSFRHIKQDPRYGDREVSRLDITFDLTARALMQMELEVLADDPEVSSGGVDKTLNERSNLDILAAGYHRLPQLSILKLKPLLEADLDEEIRRVLAHLYHAFGRISEQQTFVSWSSALDLRWRHYDPSDYVYVLSRRDSTPGFTDQERWRGYVDSLRKRVHPIGLPAIRRGSARDEPESGINQVRVVIAKDRDSAISSVGDLRGLHRDGTLFYLPQAQLHRYEYLRDLRFGLLISTRHRYAMISIPFPACAHTSNGDISQFVKDHNGDEGSDHYEPATGEMRALVTADAEYVDKLIKDFEKMLSSPDITCLPSGSKLAASNSSENPTAAGA
jgi:hypothetical protein